MSRSIIGDCIDVLPTLEAGSVQCCVTSPPYWGLRDYGTATWDGGDAECDHVAPPTGGRTGSTLRGSGQRGTWSADGQYRQDCAKCGARRIDSQIGLEATPDEYVAKLVAVFREVKRVLRDDGALWLNLGESYSRYHGNKNSDVPTSATNGWMGGTNENLRTSAVSNLSNFLKREFEGGVFFYGSADPRRRSSERINVLVYDKRAPDPVFEPLFASQRITIKNGKDDLCEIGGAFDSPVICWIGSTLSLAVPRYPDAKGVMDISEYIGVIVATGDLNADAALRATISFSIKNGKAPFAVEVPREPVAELIASGVPVFDSVTFHPCAECRAQVNTIDDPVALLDCSELLSGGRFNFAVRPTGSEKASLFLHDGTEITFVGVSHLFRLSVGLTPYSSILDKAQQTFNENRSKQELGIPEMVKRALMRDGWICRQTIIWSKPNPMPESVRDRCTKAHEYIFLLSKRERYYFDCDAIAEPLAGASIERLSQPTLNQQHGSDRVPGKTNGPMRAVRGKALTSPRNDGNAWNENNGRGFIPNSEFRNKRSVWTVTTKPFSGAHFATFPPDLIEPCILAGSRVGDLVLDPFGGSGTTGQVAEKLGREWLLIELNPGYAELQRDRTAQQGMVFA